MPLTVEPFGEHPDGSPVTRFTLESASGLTLRVLDYGGVVQALEVPDVHGRRDNVVLGFSDLGGYLGAGEDYFGGVIGRFANRISGAASRWTACTTRWIPTNSATASMEANPDSTSECGGPTRSATTRCS